MQWVDFEQGLPWFFRDRGNPGLLSWWMQLTKRGETFLGSVDLILKRPSPHPKKKKNMLNILVMLQNIFPPIPNDVPCSMLGKNIILFNFQRVIMDLPGSPPSPYWSPYWICTQHPTCTCQWSITIHEINALREVFWQRVGKRSGLLMTSLYKENGVSWALNI